LAFIAIVFAWCLIPNEPGTARTVLRVIKGVGIVGLVFLLAIFRSEPVATEVMFIGPVEDWVWLRTQWWGILGLIGWAYLVASLVYLSVGHRREWLMGATAMLVLVYFAFNGGGLFVRVNDKSWLQPILPAIEFARSGIDFLSQYIDIGGATGSLAAVSVAGCLLGSILIGPQQIEDHPSRLRWSLAFAFGLFLGGLLCDPLAGINKIAGTPTWGLWSASLTCLVWAVVYLIMDVRGVTRWSVVARPAGANPLIAYLLHPVLIGCLSLMGLSSTLLAYKSSQNVGVVVAGSVIMSLTVCALTGLIARAGLRVRI
jgi:predicted acyltransferase